MMLLADSGSTKTKWVYVNDSQRIDYTGIGLNPHFVSETQLVKELSKVAQHFQIASLNQIHFYGTGITSNVVADPMLKVMSETFQIQREKINLQTDLVGAYRALFKDQEGVTCILGTGAATARMKDGEILEQQPSLGFWLGDEGSGADLGKELIKKYLRNDLGPCISAFEKKYGAFDRHFVFEQIKKERPNAWFASFVPFLKEREEEEILRKLVEKRFRIFVESNLLKYSIEADQNIGFVGSVAYYFKNSLQRVVSQYMDNEILVMKDPIPGLIAYH
ncbi:hypothetical protein [Jiulongibacter sp. NS-SX5]|uniref:hypothetical protein n=1 Tax=Jiulongibacter sp. NS-SX5 TaxID=3463854 RepID=UPI004057DD10